MNWSYRHKFIPCPIQVCGTQTYINCPENSLQDTFSEKEKSAGFRMTKTPKPMQVLRAEP